MTHRETRQLMQVRTQLWRFQINMWCRRRDHDGMLHATLPSDVIDLLVKAKTVFNSINPRVTHVRARMEITPLSTRSRQPLDSVFHWFADDLNNFLLATIQQAQASAANSAPSSAGHSRARAADLSMLPHSTIQSICSQLMMAKSKGYLRNIPGMTLQATLNTLLVVISNVLTADGMNKVR